MSSRKARYLRGAIFQFSESNIFTFNILIRVFQMVSQKALRTLPLCVKLWINNFFRKFFDGTIINRKELRL